MSPAGRVQLLLCRLAWPGVTPPRRKVCKVFKRNDLLPDLPVQVCGLKEKSPGGRRSFFPSVLRIAGWRN